MKFTQGIDSNTRNLLMSELHSAAAYIERLFHAVVDMSNLYGRTSAKELCEGLSLDLLDYTKSAILGQEISTAPVSMTGPKATRERVKNLNQLYITLLKLDFCGEALVRNCVSYINLLYKYGHKIHKLCQKETDLEIQYPRVNLIEMTLGSELINADNPFEQLKESEQEQVAHFKLPIENFLGDGLLRDVGQVTSLNWQRDKKHQELVQLGHEQIFHKKYDGALESFIKAKSFKDTAEVLTLIGWVYGLLGKAEKAKSFCLKSIKKDPDYGPPYNDLGTFLLKEGQVKESIKWFEMAKKCLNYQNREFPFINAGRAYMALKEYKKALKEFNRALELAPFHKDLQITINKLKKNLDLQDYSKLPNIPKREEINPTEFI